VFGLTRQPAPLPTTSGMLLLLGMFPC
jgi:hypothetical protein